MDVIYKECMKYIGGEKGRDGKVISEVIKSKVVKCAKPIYMGKTIVETTTKKQSYFDKNLLESCAEDLKKKKYTNCMRFVKYAGERFGIAMDNDFINRHGEVLA